MLEVIEGKKVDAAIKGSKKVTCKEARELINKDKVIKVWWRPDGFIDYNDPDNDFAYVWFHEEQ